MKKIFCFLYILGTILIIGIILELVVRFLHLAPEAPEGSSLYIADQYLPFMTRPFARKYVQLVTRENTFLCQHNSAGLRDTEHSLRKPKDVFRILGIGDSFTYGYGASFEETFLYRLEKMLNQRQNNHQKIEIIKAGIPVFFPELERIFLEYYGIKYQPDLVLTVFLPNDVVDTYFGKESLKLSSNGSIILLNNRKLAEFGKFFYFHSHLCRFITVKLWPVFSARFFIRWNDVYKEGGFHENSWKKIENEYSKMANIASGIGAKLVIIYIPEKTLRKRNIDISYPAIRLSNWCKANNVFFFDILPAFQQGNNMDRFYWKEGHCNAEGYKAVAETLYKELIAQKLVP